MIIRIGMRGKIVEQWQKFLKSQGYGLDDDGKFGKFTEYHTKMFQSRNGLTDDGIVGNNTLAKAKEFGFVIEQPKEEVKKEEIKEEVKKEKIYSFEIKDNYMVDRNNYLTSKYVNHTKGVTFRKLNDLEQVIIHCTAGKQNLSKPGEEWGDPLACINYDLGANHISRTGLATATYHFYINQSGDLWQLVSMEIKTAHAGNQNNNSVAICINHDGETQSEITKELYSSLINCICYVFDKLDWGYDIHGVKERIHFHRDYSPKLCPGKLDKMKVIRDVSERLKTWGNNL